MNGLILCLVILGRVLNFLYKCWHFIYFSVFKIGWRVTCQKIFESEFECTISGPDHCRLCERDEEVDTL